MARERYRLGLASTADVTTATTTLLTVEVRLSEAQYAVQASNVALAYATGKGGRSEAFSYLVGRLTNQFVRF